MKLLTINYKFMKQKHVLLGIVAILILVGIWFWMGRGNEASAPEKEVDNIEEQQRDADTVIPDDAATNQLKSDDAVAVSDQAAGSSVTIDNFVLSKPGFIVIHEVTSEGSPGAIVGQSGWLAAGKGQDLEIMAKIIGGREYMAMVHADNGDKKFTANLDAAVKSEGQTVMATFSVVE